MRQDELYEQLAQVYDPELDQSLTELGFIHEVVIDGSEVTVTFRLPTYWCSPNFAFLMASDLRDRVLELPWVEHVTIVLADHSESNAISHGVSQGKSFQETFPGLSTEELDALRTRFRRKSFISRQERLYRQLIRSGMADGDVASLTVDGLRHLDGLDAEGQSLVQRYLSIRDELGYGTAPESVAFVQFDGSPIPLEQISEYMAQSRKTRVAQEFNAVYCRGLLQTRYDPEFMGKWRA